MRRSARNGSSLYIAFIFVCCIALLFVAGIILKLFLVLRASTFDGTHQYIVAVTGNSNQDAIISYNPQARSVVMLSVNGKPEESFLNDLDMRSDATVSIPVMRDASKMTENMLFHDTSGKGMTIIDKLRLLLFVNTLKPSDFKYQTISLPTDTKTRENLLPSLFLDQALYNENESIAIINATDQSGLGSTVAHMLTTIGANVVSVTTAEGVQNVSSLTASNTNSYTVQRLGRLFHITPSSSKNQTISDITLTLGKDISSQLQ